MTTLLFVSLVARLSQANVIIGMILCALGFGIALIARRTEKTVNKNGEHSFNGKTLYIVKTISLAMICVGLIVMIVQ